MSPLPTPQMSRLIQLVLLDSDVRLLINLQIRHWPDNAYDTRLSYDTVRNYTVSRKKTPKCFLCNIFYKTQTIVITQETLCVGLPNFIKIAGVL